MPDTEKDTAWQKFHALLRREFGGAYEVWSFEKTLKIERVKGGTITFSLPTPAAIEWIRGHQQEVLEAAQSSMQLDCYQVRFERRGISNIAEEPQENELASRTITRIVGQKRPTNQAEEIARSYRQPHRR